MKQNKRVGIVKHGWNMLAYHMTRKGYSKIPPMVFYRDVFPPGELAEWNDDPKNSNNEYWEYTGIILEFTGEMKTVQSEKDPERTYDKEIVKRHTVCDDLNAIEEVIKQNHFCCMSPMSYVGKNRKSCNARFMYALCVELDNLRTDIDPGTNEVRQIGMDNLLNQFFGGYDEELGVETFAVLPKPTYVVCSGNGVHIYYVFQDPVPLYEEDIKYWTAFKRRLTKLIWNKYTTISYKEDEIQYESLFQPFRLVGSKTKSGGYVEAFRTGEKITVEYLSLFCKDELDKVCKRTKSDIDLKKGKERKQTTKLEEAKLLWPEWYDRVVLGNGKKKVPNTWICNRAVYDWWLDRIEYEATVGHRYFCLMTLAIYALKCDISYEELEADCLRLFQKYESMTVKEDNHFTMNDVLGALQAFEDDGNFMHTTKYISSKTGIYIEPNKRNGRKRAEHLHAEHFSIQVDGKSKRITNTCRKNRELALEDMRENGEIPGRPTKMEIIQNWRQTHPDGRKIDCERETGLSRHTVLKWWD